VVITCLTSRPNGSIPVTKGSFKFTVAALAGRFRVVAVDFPGFGDSDKPIGAVYDALSFADAMLDLLDLLDALELDRADLIGNSLGGRFALELALLRYSRFRRALKTGNMAIIRSAAASCRTLTWSTPLRCAWRSVARSRIGSSAPRCGGSRVSASSAGK
jgi:pimeloyl-ACP methyl ester carboxylesterase